MATISDFLKNVWKNRKNDNSLPFYSSLLLFATIPLTHAINNIAMVFFALSVIVCYKPSNRRGSWGIFGLVLLYGFMLMSVIWTINTRLTLKALPKEIPLVLVPVLVYFMPKFCADLRRKWLTYSSWIMVGFAVVYLLRAFIRYLFFGNTHVFFYHDLVTEKLNAIHVSLFMLVAFFGIWTAPNIQRLMRYSAMSILAITLFLLSSKTVVLTFFALLVMYVGWGMPKSQRLKALVIGVFTLAIIGGITWDKIKDRFLIEWQTNTQHEVTVSLAEGLDQSVNVLSAKQAWTQADFSPNDYFPGTAFRVYQTRIFFELMREYQAWILGFGLNASYDKIQEKSEKYHLYQGNQTKEGYGAKNFHNQYLQVWGEIGILALLLLVCLLVYNLKNAYRSKDFVHFAFGIGMIIIFLTESFLWRQRGVTYFVLLYCIFNMPIAALSARSTTIK